MCEIPSIGISLDSHGLRNVAVFLSASTMFVCLFLASPFHLFQQSSQVTNRMSLSSLPDFFLHYLPILSDVNSQQWEMKFSK